MSDGLPVTCSRCGRTRNREFMRSSGGAWRCKSESTCKRRRFEQRRAAQIAKRAAKKAKHAPAGKTKCTCGYDCFPYPDELASHLAIQAQVYNSGD